MKKYSNFQRERVRIGAESGSIDQILQKYENQK